MKVRKRMTLTNRTAGLKMMIKVKKKWTKIKKTKNTHTHPLPQTLR
jgi:hypothetical protein